MDLLVHWTLDFLEDVLPQETLASLRAWQTKLLHPSSPLSRLAQQSVALLSTTAAMTYPMVADALDRLAALLATAPNAIGVVLVLVLAVVVLQVLSLVRRIMLFWTRLALRLVFWAVVGLVASAVWQRGVGRTIQDAVVIGSKLVGFVSGVVNVWIREYERAQAEQQQQQQGYRYQGRSGGGRSGAGW